MAYACICHLFFVPLHPKMCAVMYKKLFINVVALCLCGSLMAGNNDLLWDYTEHAPLTNPDRGLQFGNLVNDGPGEKNGLKGIKLNSFGWCCFTKAPVAGVLKLTFGPRTGLNRASLQVFTWTGEQPKADSLVGVTCEIRRLGTQMIPLTEDQNNIFITRLLNMEAVLQRIEFVEGETFVPSPCDKAQGEEESLVRKVNIDSLSENARFFLRELAEANKTGHKTIYLPNGVYDLDELTLTAIEADHISIIGESMEGTIIRNAPDYRFESIAKTATLRIADDVQGTVLMNLTLENALDYYKNNNGRAVALWDQGTKTICKNVRLLSHQDTYYSDKQGALKFFEDCEIHGTVDFICGDGSVYFKHCLLYSEKRNRQNKGVNYLTACKSSGEDKGYVFVNCTIKSECPTVSFGRAWRNSPRVVFLNTLVDYSAGEFKMEDGDLTQRWTKKLMNKDAWPSFGEYNTRLKNGKLLTPKKNDVTFFDSHNGNVTRTLPTVLTKKQAKQYTIENVLGTWAKEIETTLLINHK